MEENLEAAGIKNTKTESASCAGVGTGASQNEFEAIEVYRNSSNEEEVDDDEEGGEDPSESFNKEQKTGGPTTRLKELFEFGDSVKKDSMTLAKWETVSLWAKEHLGKLFTFSKVMSTKRKKSTSTKQRPRKFKKLRERQLRTIQDLERKYAQARNRCSKSSKCRSDVMKSRRLGQEECWLDVPFPPEATCPFHRLRERAKRKFKRIESNAREIIAIPVTLLRLKDPGNDMASYQYWTNRVLRRCGRPWPPYDDWTWFRIRGRAALAHAQTERAQERENVLARSEGVRELLASERKALVDAAMHFYDPDENRRRILRKFHEERCEYMSLLRRKPSWVTRYSTRSRRNRSITFGNSSTRARVIRSVIGSPLMQVFMRNSCCLRYTMTYLTVGQWKYSSCNSLDSDFMDSVDMLPTYSVCCENPHYLMPKNEKRQGLSSVGLELEAEKSLENCAALVSRANKSYKVSRWWCKDMSQDEVLPFTSSSSAGSYNDTDQARLNTITMVVKAEIHQTPRCRAVALTLDHAPSTSSTNAYSELPAPSFSEDANEEMRSFNPMKPSTPWSFIDETYPGQRDPSPTTLSGKSAGDSTQSDPTNVLESQRFKDSSSWCPRCTFVDPLQQWIQSRSPSTWSSPHVSEGRNEDELENSSSTTPEDPYQNVFVIQSEKSLIPPDGNIVKGDDLALVRPYGDRRPVFVYQVDVLELIEAEQRETLRQHHARPPCICRPGFPREGICREYASPLHKDTSAPLPGKCQRLLLLVLFLVKLAIAWFIILLLLHLFLSAKGYTNVGVFSKEMQSQRIFNTYLDMDDTVKYYIFNNTIKHENVPLTIRIYGPINWVEWEDENPHFYYRFIRVFYKNESYNRHNVELEKVLPGILNISEEAQPIYYSHTYINTTQCPEDEKLNTTYEYLNETDLWDRTWHHNISSISYEFNVKWSFVVHRYTKDDELEWQTVTALQQNNASYQWMGISEFALWYWNQSLGLYHFNRKIHTDITTDQENHTYNLAKDHDRYMSPEYEILNTKCYYSYSTFNATNEPMLKFILLWSKIPFTKFEYKPRVWHKFQFLKTVSIEGRRENHSLFANETDDESEYTVTYAYKYSANIWSNSVVSDNFKRRSVGLAFEFEGCDEPSYTTTSPRPRDPAFPFEIEPEDASSYILYIILGLYVLLFLQVSRALAVITTAVACASTIVFLKMKPSAVTVVKYFELDHVMRYVFIMLWNGRVADTGVYDVFAKYTAMNLFALPFILPWLYFLTICATLLSDNVIAMLVLTPYVIRLFEVLKQNPKAILTSMIVLTNVTAMCSEHSSIFNRLLVQRHVDYVQEVIVWKEFPFYLQNMVSGIICLVLAVAWFYLLFTVCKPQKRKGMEVFELKHEAKLWAMVDDSCTLGSGQVNFMKRIYADERYYLIREMREGHPLRLWAKYQKIRDNKALMQLCFIMLLFCAMLYIIKRFTWGIIEFEYDASGVLSLLMIPLLILVDPDVPLRLFISRIDISTLAMMEAFFFIGNTFCLLKYPQRIVKYIHETYPSRDNWAGVVRACAMNMLWIATLASAVLGLGASVPLIETAKLMSIDIKDYVGEDIGSNVYSKSLRPIVWSITLGANIGGCATLLGNMPALATSVNANQQGYRIGALEYLVLCAVPVTAMILINYGYWAGLLHFSKALK